MIRGTHIAALAAVLLIGAAFVLWRWAPRAGAEATPGAALAETVRDAVLDRRPDPTVTVESTGERTEVTGGADAQVAPRSIPPYEFALEFRVTDIDDAPIDGASVFIAPLMHPLNRAGESDGDGRLVVRWRGFVASMDVVVAASTSSRAPAQLRLVHARSASQQHIALRAGSDVQLVPFRGAAQVYAMAHSTSVPVLSDLPVLGSIIRFTTGAEVAAMHACDDGFAYFVDPWMARCIATAEAQATDASPEVRSFTLELEALGYVEGIDLISIGVGSGPSRPTAHFALSGQVVGIDGEPVAQVLVRVRRAGARRWEATRSDEEGNYAFEQLSLAGESRADYELVAGDGDNGLARATIAGSDRASLRYDARLDRGRELHGRLLGVDDKPLGGWIVELCRDDALAPWIDFASTDFEGAFRIPSLPGGAFTLLARPMDAIGCVPLVVARNVWPTADQQDFSVAVEAWGGCLVAIADETGQSIPDAEVRLWRDDSGRGVRLDVDPAHHGFSSYTLFPGTYRVEIGAPARAWTSIEQVFVKAGETLDLRPIRLAAPARIEVAASAVKSGEPFRALLLHRGEQVESLSDPLECKAPLVIEIAPGEYEHAPSFQELAHSEKLGLRSGTTRRFESPQSTRRDDR